MLHTVLRRRAGGESVEQIQPDLITPTGKRKGRHLSVAGIYRAVAEHAKRERLKSADADASQRMPPAPSSRQCVTRASLLRRNAQGGAEDLPAEWRWRPVGLCAGLRRPRASAAPAVRPPGAP